ncbi:hypothetical protein [Mycolicibacterium diernhoferi]|uniref:ESX secretion-associated protein EspG n=1 Tax=Mycolicibacterium diernhoferi TaxID=1801 RepID=A0A1Q4HMA5_9MYCO|nr:hypothetical protein [Mycolicibacterium diernhoferi]OJZ68562.1 hypothetical protein BRW64_03065 [Mycolicibacterium diernhoferi]OPE54591.1 hypothetical protein BV510_09510 [Mycolicibacterium diernhoferi]PEG54419.1 hypothetical protein CRI78_11010 [Mycolicibacterium diernhoferi]QYL20937.1 ESX secretion-associated protein EspG [Mycolicibacterium diernhoferi]
MGVAGAVCTIAVVDLEAACALYGRDDLPQPLGRSRPVGSVWLLSREPVRERLGDGDLRDVRNWVEALARAEATVACRVSFSDEGGPDFRLHGLRAGESSFVAVQRRDDEGVDVVDIHRVTSYALAGVIAESVGLVGPGRHVRVAVSGGGDRLPPAPAAVDEYDDFGFLIPSAEPGDAALSVVDARDVAAIGTVRTWQDRHRHWGDDANSHVLQWIRVAEDGDYLYAPGGVGYAEPLDVELLRTCVEELIGG